MDILNFLQTYQTQAIVITFRVLQVLTILIVGTMIATRIAGAFNAGLKKTKMDATARRLLHQIISWGLKTVVFVLALTMLGIKVTAIVAILGGLSLAFGLSLKNNISNVADGITLLATKPFKVGEYIESSAAAGTVDRINLFTTELISLNNQRIIVPNSSIFTASVTNFSSFETRRIELVVGLGYQDDAARGTEILKAAVATVETVLQDPAVDVWLTDFGESSINYSIRAWCKRPDFLKTRHQMIINIQKACEKEGLTIPFPQRDVHIFQEK